MDSFQRCVRDFGYVDRLLELPHGRDIAVEIFRELSPYLLELKEMRDQDPTGALLRVLDYAETIRVRLATDKLSSGMQPSMRPRVEASFERLGPRTPSSAT